jgi:hypothetical protein
MQPFPGVAPALFQSPTAYRRPPPPPPPLGDARGPEGIEGRVDGRVEADGGREAGLCDAEGGRSDPPGGLAIGCSGRGELSIPPGGRSPDGGGATTE